MLLSGGATFVALIALLVCEVVWVDGADVVQWVVFALLADRARSSFLVGLLRARLATAGASRFLIEAPPTPEEAQAALRRALGDPTLELATGCPSAARTSTSPGARSSSRPDGDGRMTTPIAYERAARRRARPRRVAAARARARRGGRRGRARHARARPARRPSCARGSTSSSASATSSRPSSTRAPAFFCVVDLEGRILRFNATGERLTGVRDDDGVRGRPFWDVFVAPEHARAACAGGCSTRRAAGGSPEVETEIRAADGRAPRARLVEHADRRRAGPSAAADHGRRRDRAHGSRRSSSSASATSVTPSPTRRRASSSSSTRQGGSRPGGVNLAVRARGRAGSEARARRRALRRRVHRRRPSAPPRSRRSAAAGARRARRAARGPGAAATASSSGSPGRAARSQPRARPGASSSAAPT